MEYVWLIIMVVLVVLLLILFFVFFIYLYVRKLWRKYFVIELELLFIDRCDVVFKCSVFMVSFWWSSLFLRVF